MENANKKKLYTTHEVAKLLGVTPITVIRWIDGGKFKCYTTVGGHRRIEHEELVRFAQDYNLPWRGEEQIEQREEFLVLAVDDEEDLLSIIGDVVSSIPGVRVIQTNNAFSAGAKLVEEQPDLVLLDFLMPELDGFEFCRFVRQDPRFKEVPIIAVSALKSPSDQASMREAGVTDIVSKPFNIDHLKEVVVQFMKQKQNNDTSKAA